MRLSRNSIQKAIGAVAIGTGIASSASAGIVYELRYVGGPAGSDTAPGVTDPLHQRGAQVGTYNVELWARVSGTNATNTDEGLTNSLISVTSTQLSGGSIQAGALASGVRATAFDETGSRNGAANNITADGIGDWGGTGTDVSDTNYMLPRNATAGGSPGGGSIGSAVDATSWQWKLASFDLNVTSVGGGGTTVYNVAKPLATKSGLSAGTYAAFKQDGNTVSIANTNFGSTYANSTGISLIGAVPEPASLGLIGAAAVGLLGRRRRTK
jgi:hypothetical protein